MKFTKQQIEDAVKASTNFTQVCKILGCKHWGGYYYNIRSRIKKYDFDTSHFSKEYLNRGGNITALKKKRAADSILIHDIKLTDRVPRKFLKRALLEIGRIYECEVCKNDGTWNNKKLDLPIDHIDGDWKNNTELNLRFMCPNCHSQTKTFGNKNRNKINKRIGPKITKRKVERPTLEVLLQNVNDLGYVGTGKKYGVTDNTIRKWICLYNKWSLS